MTGHDEYLSDGFGDLVPAHDHPSYVCSTLGPVGGDAICLMLQRLEMAESRHSALAGLPPNLTFVHGVRYLSAPSAPSSSPTHGLFLCVRRRLSILFA